MSGGLIAGFLAALVGAVLTGLAVQEISGWLDAVPVLLLRLARRRLLPGNQDTLYEEWPRNCTSPCTAWKAGR